MKVLNSYVKNIKEWKAQSVEDWIQTASDSIFVGGDAVRLYFSYLSNLKNAVDIADYIGSGIDILGGVTGMVVSGIKCGKSNARRTHTRDEIKELDGYKKETLKSMSLEEKAERSDIMKMMGATEKQAANPIIESNRIYREQIRKGKSFSWFGRKWRKFKGMFSS